MPKKNTLYVGYGDLAQRVWRQLALTSTDCATAIIRSPKPVPETLQVHWGNASDPAIISDLKTHYFDHVLMTLTPAERSDIGYKHGYVDVVKALVEMWQANPPGHVVFVSSSSVYGQLGGEWVTETSPCEPQHYSGRRLLEAEQVLADSGIRSTILRLAGIYGPGRDFLQRQVKQGKGGNSSFTNRIHVEDAARFITAILQSDLKGTWAAPVFNVCDCAPAPSAEVRQWLAKQLGVTSSLQHSSVGRGGNKRCSNQRLLRTGFELRYPTYKEGYSALLKTQR